MSRALAVLAAAAALACGSPTSKPEEPAAPARSPVQEAALMQWQGAFCGVEQEQARLVETEAQWKKLWKDIGAEEPGTPDFARQFAVAVFLGQRSTGGFAARLSEPASESGASVVRYKISAPKGVVIQAITQPYHVRVYPRTGLPVKVEAAP